MQVRDLRSTLGSTSANWDCPCPDVPGRELRGPAPFPRPVPLSGSDESVRCSKAGRGPDGSGCPIGPASSMLNP